MDSWHEAPIDWAFHLFPLPGECIETVEVEAVVQLALALIARSEATGDETIWSPVPHWAHLLKTAQLATGDWPARINARTGTPIGDIRTRAPVRLFERLNELLDSTEFAAAIAQAHPPPPSL